jgi:hypothetical protein
MNEQEPKMVRGAMPPLNQYWPMPTRMASTPKGPAAGGGKGPASGKASGSKGSPGPRRSAKGGRQGGRLDRKKPSVPWL